MIAPQLKIVSKELALDSDDCAALRIAFGIACVSRVETSLTDPTIISALLVGKHYPHDADLIELQEAATSAANTCRRHQGSNSFDGSGNAAVSASYAVAAALSGRALDAAGYAAYAAVYAYSSSSVTDVSAYSDEHNWQIATLKRLSNDHKTPA